MGDFRFYASLDGGFDLGGGGDVVGGIESFEHGVRDGRLMGVFDSLLGGVSCDCGVITTC